MKEIFRQVAFFMLSIFSLLYVIFARYFAEIFVQVPFLNFPIFVGEIFLFICLILSFFVFDFRSIKGWQWGVVFYFTCVILKALWGYSLWGPLALRHAALFYYPVFIFFGFIFYSRVFLSKPLKIFIVFLILVLCVTKYFYGSWVLALWIIAFVLMRSFCNRAIRYFFYAGLLSVILLSYKVFIITARTFVVGYIAAVVFLIIAILPMVKAKIFYKSVIAGAIFILFATFVFRYATLNAYGTVLDIKRTINRYRMFEAEIKAQRPHYVPQDLKDIKLFNPERPSTHASVSYKMLKKETSVSDKMLKKETSVSDKMIEKETSVSDKMIEKETSEKKNVLLPRDVGGAYVNTSFRLFIWKDMIFEFSRNWPIIGFSFGKPLRSESLEILNWAINEWQRDGWIEPHNSYLNILYRTGILGIALIIFLILQLCRMVKGFITFNSLSGILLCSILINWLVAANFLPIFELPYSAIPFWALWGAALGYLKELKNEK